MSLTTTTARTYCYNKIKANTPQEALSGIKFFTDLENNAYIAKLLCADRFLELCGDLTIDGVKGFYLVSDDRYKALSKDDKPRHKLSSMFEAQFPNNNWKTLSEYFREFNNLKKQDVRCVTYDAKKWLSLCGDKTQRQLRMPNSVHTPKEELTTPVAAATPEAVDATPEAVDATPEAVDATPTALAPLDESELVADSDDESDEDDDGVIREVVQNADVYSRIKDICDDLSEDPNKIHKFITHLISSHESVTLPKMEKSYLASGDDEFIVRMANQTRPRRR